MTTARPTASSHAHGGASRRVHLPARPPAITRATRAMIGPATSGVARPSRDTLNATSGSAMSSGSPVPNGNPPPPSAHHTPKAPNAADHAATTYPIHDVHDLV